MRDLVPILDRFVAPLLMAAGVALLTVGLLSYAPSAFGEIPATDAPRGADNPLFSITPTLRSGPTLVPTTSPTPTIPATPAPSVTPEPTQPVSSASPIATSSASAAPAAFASRIRIPSLGIDLPVVSGSLVVPGSDPLYPLCDVALYLTEFVQPGQDGTTYIYAHAQRGMFLPLLRASEVDDGASLIGALIEVYTTDANLHVYELETVMRHALDLSITEVPAGVEQLVLQTSEGVSGTIPKLQVAARPLSVVPANHAVANPVPAPRVCGP